MSVLMIILRFRPEIGGAELALERLAAELAGRDVRTTVVTFHTQSGLPKRETRDGVDLVRLPCLSRRPLVRLSQALSLSIFLAARGRAFQIWHCHSAATPLAAAVVLGWLFRRPVAVKLLSTHGELPRRPGRAPGWPRAAQGLLRRASAIIVMTDAMRRNAAATGYPAGRTHLIPNGVDPLRFSPADAGDRAALRRRLGIPEDATVALQVCRLSPEKNLPSLLRAWAAFSAEAAGPVRLIIVGDGPLLAELRAEVATLGLTGQVMLPGASSAVEDWYRAADLYVLSSLYEGLSNSQLEAMACGLPVIMTDVSGASLIAGPEPTGLVVPVDDHVSLARALTALMADGPARAVMGANGRTRLAAEFPIGGVADRTLALYRALLKDGEAARPWPSTLRARPAGMSDAGRDVAGEQDEGLPGPPAT